MHKYILLLHVLAATVWTGGHLVLAGTILPQVLRKRSVPELLRFESAYEALGMSALGIQVASGLWLAYRIIPDPGSWFTIDHPISRLILTKLILLLLTAIVALDARLRIIPHLTAETLPAMARRIVAVTLISVLFVVVGVSFRTDPFI